MSMKCWIKNLPLWTITFCVIVFSHLVCLFWKLLFPPETARTKREGKTLEQPLLKIQVWLRYRKNNLMGRKHLWHQAGYWQKNIFMHSWPWPWGSILLERKCKQPQDFNLSFVWHDITCCLSWKGQRPHCLLFPLSQAFLYLHIMATEFEWLPCQPAESPQLTSASESSLQRH